MILAWEHRTPRLIEGAGIRSVRVAAVTKCVLTICARHQIKERARLDVALAIIPLHEWQLHIEGALLALFFVRVIDVLNPTNKCVLCRRIGNPLLRIHDSRCNLERRQPIRRKLCLVGLVLTRLAQRQFPVHRWDQEIEHARLFAVLTVWIKETEFVLPTENHRFRAQLAVVKRLQPVVWRNIRLIVANARDVIGVVTREEIVLTAGINQAN